MGKTSKVVVCGAKKCGKTSILEQAINGSIGVSNVSNVYIFGTVNFSFLD